jgi:hypothetical protein
MSAGGRVDVECRNMADEARFSSIIDVLAQQLHRHPKLPYENFYSRHSALIRPHYFARPYEPNQQTIQQLARTFLAHLARPQCSGNEPLGPGV